MRVLPAILLAALGGAAVAGEAGPPHTGKVVRVERPPGREVFVPAGTFLMGVSEDDADMFHQACETYFELREAVQFQTPSGQLATFCSRYREELDQMTERHVFLSAFAIDRDEVSTRDYRGCVAAGACNLDPLIAGDERYIRDEWPIVNVTWDEAQDYCRWRGGRLPTEAEWERAARGDDNRPWPWGQTERNDDFNHGQPRAQAMRELDRTTGLIPIQLMGDPDDSDGFTLLAPPGSYPWGEGPYHTRDQAGNVAEWTADARSSSDATLGYKDLPGCSQTNEGHVACINPRRDGTQTDTRVVRGGSWRSPPFLGRANVRDPYNLLYDPHRRFSHIGFRCARTL